MLQTHCDLLLSVVAHCTACIPLKYYQTLAGVQQCNYHRKLKYESYTCIANPQNPFSWRYITLWRSISSPIHHLFLYSICVFCNIYSQEKGTGDRRHFWGQGRGEGGDVLAMKNFYYPKKLHHFPKICPKNRLFLNSGVGVATQTPGVMA